MEDFNEVLGMHCDMSMEALGKMAKARTNLMQGNEAEKQYFLLKSLTCIDKLMEPEGGYSRDGEWHANGSYADGRSGTNRGMHYVRGHYSRDNRDYRNGEYAGRDYGASYDEMMRVASPNERRMLEELRNKM